MWPNAFLFPTKSGDIGSQVAVSLSLSYLLLLPSVNCHFSPWKNKIKCLLTWNSLSVSSNAACIWPSSFNLGMSTSGLSKFCTARSRVFITFKACMVNIGLVKSLPNGNSSFKWGAVLNNLQRLKKRKNYLSSGRLMDVYLGVWQEFPHGYCFIPRCSYISLMKYPWEICPGMFPQLHAFCTLTVGALRQESNLAW